MEVLKGTGRRGRLAVSEINKGSGISYAYAGRLIFDFVKLSSFACKGGGVNGD